MLIKITVIVEGGLVQDVIVDDEDTRHQFDVEIRDYDIEGALADELEEDAEGREYIKRGI